ncbi:MAG: hypothetical protein IPQ15_10285 [Betaproteobacteria bacterium]|nr:hypothetical protein [Betaproteobacteria bacterium]
MTCQPTCRIQRSTDLDPHDFAHGIVEGAFSLIFPDPQARLRLGLRAISRAGHGGMAWYVWTAERTGAYEIALVPDFPDDAAGGAVLALRYFPDPDEPAFQDFSTVEQAVRRSSLFDRTGTPAFDQADALDPALFCIGSLVLVPQGEERFTLRLHVPDRWIEETPDGEGATDRRDVAAAELALPIVDALVGGVVYLGRAAPASVQIWRRPGTVLRGAADDRAPRPADPAVTEWEIEWSGLAMPGRSPGFDPASAGRRPAGPPWFAHASETPPATAPWPVNARWWQAAHWHFDPVGMYCGHCAAEEAAGHVHILTHHCEDAHHEHRT